MGRKLCAPRPLVGRAWNCKRFHSLWNGCWCRRCRKRRIRSRWRRRRWTRCWRRRPASRSTCTMAGSPSRLPPAKPPATRGSAPGGGERLNGLESYAKPLGFMRLTEENGELFVSDHYRLRDFQCKLDGESKFLILRPEALLKLELLQHELAEHGIDFDRFTIMSGFRTPYYNARIGNETSYSRHLYGDAMDVYIDRNGDGRMDDINK